MQKNLEVELQLPGQSELVTIIKSLEELNKTVKLQSEEMKNINLSIKSMQNLMDELKSSQTFLNEKFEETIKEVNNLKKSNYELKNQVKDFQGIFEEHEKFISMLESKVDGFHQEKIENNLLITGLPLSEFDVNQAVMQIFGKLNSSVNSDAIKNIRVINSKRMERNAGGNKMIEQKFLEVELKAITSKTEVLKKFREKGSLFTNEVNIGTTGNRRIFIREQLTTFKAKLFRASLIFKSQHLYKHLWVADHKIHLRKDDNSKVHTINNFYELKNLKSKYNQ